jgi:hypothetical protein
VGLCVVGLTFFSGKAEVLTTGVIVDGADSVSISATEYSVDLAETAKNVPPRMVVEYADSISGSSLQNVMVPDIKPRIIVEYADSIFVAELAHASFKPFASFTFSPAKPLKLEDIVFNASTSCDPDGGNIVNYRWVFYRQTGTLEQGIAMFPVKIIEGGDKQTVTSSFEAGNYLVELTLTDDESETSKTSRALTIAEDWTFAIITDIHMGYNNTDYGTLGWDDSGGDDYRLTDRLTTIVDWINSHEESNNIHFVAVLGDISDSGEKSELMRARDILNGLNIPYIPVIGNHDIWPYTQKVGTTDPNHIEYCWQDWRTTKGPYATIADYPTTRPAVGDQLFDEVFWEQNSPNLGKILRLFGTSFRRQSDAVEYEHIQNCAFTYKGVKFIALDFIDRNPLEDTQSSGAKLNDDTEWWLEVNLVQNEKTVFLSHHPMFYDRLVSTGFPKSEAQLIGQIIKDSGAIILKNFAGHTHRTAEAGGEGTEIQVVTTAAVCRESCSLTPDQLVTRETQTRLVTITYRQELRSYDILIRTKDQDISVPKPSWLAKARALIGSLCPIDLIVTDPEGFSVSKEVGSVSGMTYFECDWTGESRLEDLIFLEDVKPGDYQIQVIAEASALPNDTYSFAVFSSDGMTWIAEDVAVGDIPSEPYVVNSIVFELNVPPTTSLGIGVPKISNGTTYISPSTPLDFVASDNLYGSGLNSTEYRIYNATFDTGWTIYTQPIYLAGLNHGAYQIDYYSTDCAGNVEAVNSTTVVLSNPNMAATCIVPLAKTVVGQGFSLDANVTVQNQGIFSEGFDIALCANATITDIATDVVLTSGNSTTVTFTWNTSGFAEGNYTISAYVWLIPGETNTTDNLVVVGQVLISIPGDINGDFIVDIFDAIMIAGHFNQTPIHPLWNADVDVNSDQIVDIFDAIVVAGHFSEHYP